MSPAHDTAQARKLPGQGRAYEEAKAVAPSSPCRLSPRLSTFPAPSLPLGEGKSASRSSFMASWTWSQKAENLAVWAGFLLSAALPHFQLINIKSRARRNCP